MRHKLKAIVVKEQPKGETSKLLTILTDSMGVLTINAKGVRKLSSPYLKSAQLFAFSDMLLYEKNGYYTLTEAALITDFYPLSKDIVNYSLACYLCDAASSFAVQGDESASILRLLLNSLYALENGVAPERLIKAAFELRICCECGFEPLTDCCSSCGDELNEGYFDITEGEMHCKNCGASDKDIFLLSSANLKALQHVSQCELSKFLSFRVSETDMLSLATIAERYFLQRAERGFKTLSFYKKCKELN